MAAEIQLWQSIAKIGEGKKKLWQEIGEGKKKIWQFQHFHCRKWIKIFLALSAPV